LNRENFQINPKQSLQDAKLYFGKNQNAELIAAITKGYAAGYVPRVYIFGNYGTGKTHLLFHLKYHFESLKDAAVIPILVQLEAESRTRFQSLHKRLLDGITIERIDKAYQDFAFVAGADRDARFRELFADPNLHRVMPFIQAGPAFKHLAWRWITGERLTSSEQAQLGVTASLTETGDMVGVLIAVGELFKRVDRRLLFLVDEAEALHNVSNADSQGSWHDAFRRLADPNDNQSVGWIVSFYQTLNDDAPRFMMEADITTRLGRNGRIQLPPLQNVEVRQFLVDLLGSFVDKDCAAAHVASASKADPVTYFPFTDGGLNAFLEHARQAPESAIPRTILKALTACALEALDNSSPLLDADVVNRVAPAEFAEP
jgi:hypothetical protein